MLADGARPRSDDPTETLVADLPSATGLGLRKLLDDHPRFAVVGEACDAPGAVALAVATSPRLAVLDPAVPGSGIAAAWEIHRRRPECAVVMLGTTVSTGDLRAALRAGVSGFLLRSQPGHELVAGLRLVAGGTPTLAPRLLRQLMDDFRDRAPCRRAARLVSAPHAALTSREWMVLDLLRDEATTAEIADALGVTAATIRTHLMALRRKLGVSSRAELVGVLAA